MTRRRHWLLLTLTLAGCAAQPPRITPVVSPVRVVRVSPNPVLLAVGARETLTVEVLGAGDVAIPGRTVSWSSDDTLVARISPNGVLEGVAAGSAEIRATSDGVTGSTLVAVNAPAAAAPAPAAAAPRAVATPEPRSAPLTDECRTPHPEWLWCDDFDIDRLGAYFEYDAADGAFVRTLGAGTEGSWGMRARWTPRQVAAGALHLAVGRTPQPYMRSPDGNAVVHRELFWRFFVRNQTGWTGGGGDKLTRAFVFASESTWAQAAIVHVWSGADDSPTEEVLVIDPARGTDEAGALRTTAYNDFRRLQWLGIGTGSDRIFAESRVGDWHCIEVHVRLNDPGLTNGIAELWVDGRPDAERRGLNLLGAFGPYGLNAVYLENYWNAGSPAAQERTLDNFVVSRARIGC